MRPSDRFYDAVETLAGLGVLHTDVGAEFGPYEPETRAEFAFSLAALLNLAPLYGSAFDDVSPGDWFSGAVGSLYGAGLVQGTGDGRFDPDVELSRQQAATLLMRGYSYGPGAGRDPGGGLLADEPDDRLLASRFRRPRRNRAQVTALLWPVLTGLGSCQGLMMDVSTPS